MFNLKRVNSRETQLLPQVSKGLSCRRQSRLVCCCFRRQKFSKGTSDAQFAGRHGSCLAICESLQEKIWTKSEQRAWGWVCWHWACLHSLLKPIGWFSRSPSNMSCRVHIASPGSLPLSTSSSSARTSDSTHSLHLWTGSHHQFSCLAQQWQVLCLAIPLPSS